MSGAAHDEVVVVLESLRSPAAQLVVRALASTSLEVRDGESSQPLPPGGVSLVGEVADMTSAHAAAARARQAGRALLLLDPGADIVPALMDGSVNGVVLTSGARAGRLAPFLGALPWLRLPMPIDERPLTAAAHSRAQHRAGLSSHLRLSGTTPWLLGAGPNASPDTWRLLARCLSRVLTLPWCLIATPRAGETAAAAEEALRALPQQRLRLWPSPSDSDAVALMVASDLCVWPGSDATDAEHLLAAQAAGLPALACRGMASDECVRDGLTGRIVQTGNAEALANVLAFLLRNEQFQETMSRQAREIILGDHGLGPVGSVVAKFIRRYWSSRPVV